MRTKRSRAEDMREFNALLPQVAAHFGLTPTAVRVAKHTAITRHVVSAHALDCYRAIVRSLGGVA